MNNVFIIYKQLEVSINNIKDKSQPDVQNIIQQKNDLIQTLNDKIQSLNNTISEKNNSIDELNRNLNTSKATITQNDENISHLKNKLLELSHINEQNGVLIIYISFYHNNQKKKKMSFQKYNLNQINVF